MLETAVLLLVVAAFCVALGVTRWVVTVALLLLLVLHPLIFLALLAVAGGAFYFLRNR